jgi:hypothetical protein
MFVLLHALRLLLAGESQPSMASAGYQLVNVSWPASHLDVLLFVFVPLLTVPFLIRTRFLVSALSKTNSQPTFCIINVRGGCNDSNQ